MSRARFLMAWPLRLVVGCGVVGCGVVGCGHEEASRSPRAVETTEAAEISERGNAGPIRLHLDWPAGARGRVETSRTVMRSGLPESGRSTARYRIQVSRRGSEITMRTSDLEIRTPEGGPGETLNGILVAATYLPSARFTADVEQLSLVDPERTGEMLRNAIDAATTDDVRAMPAFQSVAPMLRGEPEMLTRQVGGLLGPITLLDGIPVQRGELVAMRDERDTSVGERARQSTTTTLLGTGPCFEGDREDGCVSLEVSAHYDADQLAGAAGPGPASIRSIDGTLRLVIEAETLLPHRMEARKESVFVAPVGGELEEMQEVESLRWIFRWERGSIRE